jgi:D-xylonolactonase
VIVRADYDRATGALTNRRPFYTAPEAEGTPDGLTIDRAGELWSARWGGSRVLHIGVAGQLLGEISLPVTRVSSATFGGPELDTLYVTTAGGLVDDGALDGTLYRVNMPVAGRPEFRSRIRI